MADLWRGIDTDNYDQAVSVQRFRSLYDNHGMKFNLVGCQVGADGANYTAVQIANSETAGLWVPFTYEFPWYQGDNPRNSLTRMRHAMSFGRPVSPDIEAPPNVVHPQGAAGLVDLMHQVKDMLVAAGLFWGWYSSPEEWGRLTGNTQEFAGDLSWSATYPYKGLPPEDFMPDWGQYPAFGGLIPVIQQYADKCYDEPTFDMNAMLVPTPPPGPSPEPTPPPPPPRFIDGIGLHWSDGAEERIWTPS